jgi:hypothetical protein
VLGRQSLDDLSHATTHFCFGCFGDNVSIFAQASLDHSSCFTLLVLAGMTGACHHTQVFSVEMVSHKFFCLNWPGTVIFLIPTSHIAWDDRCGPPCPRIG